MITETDNEYIQQIINRSGLNLINNLIGTNLRNCHICGKPGATVSQDAVNVIYTHTGRCSDIFFINEQKANQ